MTHKEALKELKRCGTAHAQGDALCAMYASLICMNYWGKKLEPKFYAHLQKFADEKAIMEEARSLMRDHSKTLDIALGLGEHGGAQ